MEEEYRKEDVGVSNNIQIDDVKFII